LHVQSLVRRILPTCGDGPGYACSSVPLSADVCCSPFAARRGLGRGAAWAAGRPVAWAKSAAVVR
jgi:hypothetical protein